MRPACAAFSCTVTKRRSCSRAFCRTRTRPCASATRARSNARAAYAGEHILLDAYVPGHAGGTGATFDWELATALATQRKVTLAGGLQPENVAARGRPGAAVLRRRGERRGDLGVARGARIPRASAPSSAPRRPRGLEKPAAVPYGPEPGAIMSKLPSMYGPFGGRFVAETLMPALDELEAACEAARNDPAFEARRPAAARRLRRPADAAVPRRAAVAGGRVAVFLKREDLCHTGAHKINNCVGQVLLARRMGKRRIIAETGAGQHGVATATGRRAVRPPVRGLHGRRGRRAPGARTSCA